MAGPAGAARLDLDDREIAASPLPDARDPHRWQGAVEPGDRRERRQRGRTGRRCRASEHLAEQSRLEIVAHERLAAKAAERLVGEAPAKGVGVGTERAVVAPRAVNHDEARAAQIAEPQHLRPVAVVEVQRPVERRRPAHRAAVDESRAHHRPVGRQRVVLPAGEVVSLGPEPRP